MIFYILLKLKCDYNLLMNGIRNILNNAVRLADNAALQRDNVA
jgi:hypothetical protein